jgi:hypothetical protein
MKSRQILKLIPRWEPEQRFAVPLHHHAPIARRAPEFLPEYFLWLEEEAWRTSAPLS